MARPSSAGNSQPALLTLCAARSGRALTNRRELLLSDEAGRLRRSSASKPGETAYAAHSSVRRGRRPYSTRLTRTTIPSVTSPKAVASPSVAPNTLTGLYAFGFSPVLIGVAPKKMQNALPGGQ